MKFMNMKSKEAVSPVIAVILMVAITVVLAATVYVWVSGFKGTENAPTGVAFVLKGTVGAQYLLCSSTGDIASLTATDVKVFVNGVEDTAGTWSTSAIVTAGSEYEYTGTAGTPFPASAHITVTYKTNAVFSATVA